MSTLLAWATPANGGTPSADPMATATGHVAVDLATGRVDGRICVAQRAADVAGAFALNAGLNVARVTDGAGAVLPFGGLYAPGIDGEARVYTVAAAPPVLCVEYLGAFPVYAAHDAVDDFKGVMAFNGDSARFSEQTAWLPMPYDPAAKRRASALAYDLEIACTGCRFLYVNGAAPVVGERGRFASALARPPLFFGGTGPITQAPNATILNEAVSDTQADTLSMTAARIAAYYTAYMGRPLADLPTFLRMVTIDQVERDRKGGEWAFATWPTIAMSGSVANVAATLATAGDQRDAYVAYLAHEMGHYYFGTLTVPQGPYSWFLLESTAEFLSIKALRDIAGDDAAARRIADMKRRVAKHEGPFTPLDGIVERDEIDAYYRYLYGPLLLLSLEAHGGEVPMRALLRDLVERTDVHTWDDLHQAALRAGIDPAAWDQWRRRCVASGLPDC